MAIHPLLKKTDDIYIPPRFHRAVLLHVLKNHLKKVDVRIPLLLGIHGPSGEGKTIQCETILRKMGVKRFLISGGQMDSPLSGEPAQLVRTTYLRAGEELRRGECSLAVLLINDIDAGLGSMNSTSGFSQNQQTVFAELMHLVDYPTMVEGGDTPRVPVIITGNDFTRLYKPLVRAGRMTSFEWIPTPEEKSHIIVRIFPELTREECLRLIEELGQACGIDQRNPNESLTVAFYSHLRAALLDEDLWREVEQAGMYKLIDDILAGREPDLSSSIRYDRVLQMGIELATKDVLINHLR